MDLITKPETIYKGTSYVFTLDLDALAEHPGIEENYWKDNSNWKKVVLLYKSSIGNQSTVVVFRNQSDTGNFKVSIRARSLFQLKSVIIYDFDGAFYPILRDDFTLEEQSELDVSVL